ncbi:hypothetical protein [Nocardioides daejeonensis]|uniref:hypothetical protein n=1 Tax=Nocardioides daejeonensis TaxID=1046556 RepID=UPI000D7422BA|nr:hypothetical protein [Nocardioides daejeonensis]
MESSPRAARRRLLAAVVCAGMLAAGVSVANSLGSNYTFPDATPTAKCGKGSLPEASQGRVPKADYANGRAAKGYRCNTRQVSHHGTSGGFKVLRYKDAKGNVCAFYDSTLTVPRDILYNMATGAGLGVVVLDMNNPRKPRRTANLVTPAMLSPHESLLLHEKRGILAATMGTLATAPGILDLYDVKTNCRKPRLLSSTPAALLGHESGMSPDGKTFYAASSTVSMVAIDIADPRRPKTIHTQLGVQYHGLRLSDDGRTMYATWYGEPGPGGLTGGGIRIVDVSQIQDRVRNPKTKVLSTVTWREMSIPQVAQPFTRNGRHYLLEVDEFIDLFTVGGLKNLKNANVGAARIIDVEDPAHPKVVSDIRLKVHQPDQRSGPQYQDPGAWFPAQGYSAHYCSLPQRKNPKLAACSMIMSGLRVFDIRDVKNPREVAYFNKPAVKRKTLTVPDPIGAYAMSQPAWDRKRRSIWYSDANTGFFAVRLTNGVGKLLD